MYDQLGNMYTTTETMLWYYYRYNLLLTLKMTENYGFFLLHRLTKKPSNA